MFAVLPPWQRYLPLPILPPSTLSPPHPTCLLSQPPAPLLVPVSTLVRLLHTTSLHIAQLPIQHWIQRILEEHIQKLHSWQQQPPPHPWQFENMFVWCLERDSNSSSQGARAEGSPFLDALASLDSKLSVGQWVIYRFQLTHLRVFQIFFNNFFNAWNGRLVIVPQ